MRVLLFSFLSLMAAHAQTVPPVINLGGIVSAASYQTGQYLIPPAAPVLSGGSLISIFGQNLAVGSIVATSLPLPTTLGSTSVLFQDSSGFRHPVRLLFVSPSQINAQAPAQINIIVASSFWSPGRQGYAAGAFIVRVEVQESAGGPVLLHDSAPAVFTVPSASNQLAYLVSARDGALIAPTRGALPSEPVTLYLTGLGPARGGTPGVIDVAGDTSIIRVPDGQPAPLTSAYPVWTIPTVTIGGRPATVLFAGLAPGFVGLDQLNFVIPPDAPLGCNVPITITGDDYSSAPATLSVSANAGPCQ